MIVLACTLQLCIAYKELSVTDLIRFLQPLSDINRTGSVVRKGRVYCKEHKTCSDGTSVQLRATPWLCLLGQVTRPLRASLCFKGNDISFLKELTSKLNVCKHQACNKCWINENRIWILIINLQHWALEDATGFPRSDSYKGVGGFEHL